MIAQGSSSRNQSQALVPSGHWMYQWRRSTQKWGKIQMSLLGEQQTPSIHCQGFQKDNNLINASTQGLFNNPKESEHLQTCGSSYQQEVWTTPTLNSLNHICNANVDIKYKKYKFQKSSECLNPFAPGVIPSPSHDSRDTRHIPGPISQHIPRFFPC